MAIKKTITLESGIDVVDAYIRIYKAEIVNGDRVVAEYQIFKNEELCNHGKGVAITKILPLPIITKLKTIMNDVEETYEELNIQTGEMETKTRIVHVPEIIENPAYLPFLAGSCVEQAYTYMKTLPEFENAVDC